MRPDHGTPLAAGNPAHEVTETWQAELAYPAQAEKQPPCRANCPSGTDVRGWINLIAQREKNGLGLQEACTLAWRKLVECNPLPAAVARVCPHTCESQCNRDAREGAVSIHAMERFIGDWALRQGLRLPTIDDAAGKESIGVVGSGPAGLSFAYQMARRGYPVTLYERHAMPGGMLAYGIPAYRLPRDILLGEIDRIVALGVDLCLNTRVGQDVSLAALRDRHQAVFIGIGADRPLRLDIPGEDGPGVLGGTQFMFHINQGHDIELGKTVVVVGGGNTAIDAARAARRRGAAVVLLYRRTREQMPAIAEEVDDALAEGVQIRFLAAPVAIRRDGERITAVAVQEMELGGHDAQGRPQPVPIPGRTRDIPADTMICAISQTTDWRGFEDIAPAGGIHADEWGHIGDGIWSGGDALALGTVTRAIGHGRRAAEALHAQLRGTAPPSRDERPPLRADGMRVDHYSPMPPTDEPRRPPGEWLSEPEREIRLGIGEEQFLAEASRCLSCGNCFGCQLCWMYCNASAYAKREITRPGEHFALDRSSCEGCGKCAELCPCGYLSIEGAAPPTTALTA